MAADIVGHLPGRFVIVVGKGGVGKSTTSAALALGMADGGAATHLLSTDPAHSLGDVFACALPRGEVTPSPCTDRLVLEEMDAPERTRRWFGDVQEAVAEVVDRGTYLDTEDVAALLDHSLLGMDEVMAALRLTELATDRTVDRIVVDTAPTGHTLRLLDGGRTVRGWLAALGAMADKAAAVGTALTGRRVRLAGERVMADLDDDVRRYEDEVLREASFVVVTRPDEVVSAETARLVEGLRERGLTVAAVIGIGEGVDEEIAGTAPRFEVPLGRDLIGCEGLRRWGAAASRPANGATRARAASGAHTPGITREPGPGTTVPEPSSDAADDTLTRLGAREVVFFAGKGGVGKSTCAAATALAIARERTVLLVSLDPAGSLAEVLDRPVDAGDTRVGPRLVARQLDATARFDEFRSRYRERILGVFERLGLDRSAALDRRVLASILEMAPPGIDEIFALDAVLDGPGEHDVLVLDTAPTGHFLRLMEMPEAALGWTRTVLRILLKYRSVLALDDFARDMLDLARRLRDVVELLRDPERSAVVVVTLDEPLPLRETGRLLGTLDERGFPVAAVVRNRWEHDRGSVFPPAAPTVAIGYAGTTIRAPRVSPEPVGSDRLRAFVERWSVA